MKILGLSSFYHDSAAALINEGKLIAAAQEERFTRIKHDNSFPQNAINYCLMQAGIEANDLDYIAYYEKPFLKFERIMETYLSFAPKGYRMFLKTIPLWLKRKLWIKSLIRTNLDFNGTILFPEHHESHASSAFYPSPFQDSAILTIDGVGEWSTTTYGIGNNNNLELLADIRFPDSIGLLYSAFTYYTGFKVNSGEYKLMGLASYGEPKYKTQIYDELIDVKDDGSFKLNMNYFDYCTGHKMINYKFEKLFKGPPRKPESDLTQKDMDLAKSIQEVTEEIIFKIAFHIKKETDMENLCLAGGVALNCVANGKLLKEKIFSNIWIQPASGDAGGALGSALAVHYKFLGNTRNVDNVNDMMNGAYLGPDYTNEEIELFLNNKDINYKKISDEEIPPKISKLINDEKIIGWFQGRMEFGPRALGSRSIIADARSITIKEKMNQKIKFRESFRPFAPSVLEEQVSKWFDLDHISPYMLLATTIKKDRQIVLNKDEKKYVGVEKLKAKRSEIPAVTHVDYSARVHTINNKTNPLLHKTIKIFQINYGCPVIVNTSFNVRGEPIVCKPEDAYNCFMKTEMDYLLIGNFIINKKTILIDNKQCLTI